jgi:hypothetical protein
MPLCYSFSNAAAGPQRLSEDEIKDAAGYLMARLDRRDTPTWKHLCATLEGQYDYLLKFEYSALSMLTFPPIGHIRSVPVPGEASYRSFASLTERHHCW